jgi:hypothetical protein
MDGLYVYPTAQARMIYDHCRAGIRIEGRTYTVNPSLAGKTLLAEAVKMVNSLEMPLTVCVC